MSKDIRSFFKSTKAPAKSQANLNDSDVIPESPEVQIKNNKKESRKRRILDDSSDDDIFEKKSNQSIIKEKVTPKGKSKITEKSKLKEVKVSDIFGKGSIKRTEPIVKKENKKSITETGIHSDEEFEKSLLELDNIPSESKSKNSIEENGHEHSNFATVSEYFNGESSKAKPLKNLEKCKPDIKIDENKKSITAEKKSTDTLNVSSKDNDFKKREVSKDGVKGNVIKSEKTPTKPKEKSKTVKEIKEEIRNEKKRDFAEFIENGNNSQTSSEEHRETSSKSKKIKLDQSLNESVMTDEERYEKRRHSAALYQSYLNRSGPKHLGAKEIPEGAPDCLKDCAFLLTGVLDSFEREEVVAAIAKYGGVIKNSVSKKVTHVLAGDEAGPAKLAKAQDLHIKIINEDDFLQMIANSKSKKTNHEHKSKEEKKDKLKSRNNKSENKDCDSIKADNKDHGNVKSNNKDRGSIKSENKDYGDIKSNNKDHGENRSENKHHIQDNYDNNKRKGKTEVSTDKMKELEEKIQKNFYSKGKEKNESPRSGLSIKSPEKESTNENEVSKDFKKSSESTQKNKESTSEMILSVPSSLMWVEKYKPKNIKQIIGQNGDSSNAKKLMHWLSRWYINRKEKIPKPSPWAKNDDGAYYKAALLSGPPGVGKTTTVSLVCAELGFDAVEFNASDTRSKTLIKEQISELLGTSSLVGFAKGDTGRKAVTKKHVLVMDEVDGMAGNEDRGGLQELISLIKQTSVPIVCMCNDRNSPKMRSLVNYCYDLKFSRPRVDQIKSAMMSVCFKEGIKISPEALAQVIVASNQDVRQILNLLSMWSVNDKHMDTQQVKKDADIAKKDMKLGPWEAVRKVFSEEDQKSMSLNDKSDLFFYDYSLAPLFVQENYLQVAPHCPKKEVLHRLSQAADSISLGDLVEKKVRSQGAWNLLPVQAMLSSVIPGHALCGHVAGQIQFPSWLGKNSRRNKMHRMCQEIHAHTRLSTSGSKSSIFLDYSRHLRDAVVSPLVRDKAEGIPQSLDVLHSYNLLREDLDSLTELALWPGQRDPMVMVDSKVKAAMTRTYNKGSAALPYAPGAVKKSRARADDDADAYGDDEDDVAPDDTDSDPDNDAMVKKKKKSAEKSKDSEKPSTSKGKERKTQKKS